MPVVGGTSVSREKQSLGLGSAKWHIAEPPSTLGAM